MSVCVCVSRVLKRWGDGLCWMELGQGTRRNLNAQRCTLSSIGFSVFSLCLYVLGFYKNPVGNKYIYFYGSHCLLCRVLMKNHHLQLNLAKTELMVFPARQVIPHNIKINTDSLSLAPSTTARNLGVIIDDQLNFTAHIASVSRSCRFALY